MNRNNIRKHAAVILSLFMMLSLLGSGIIYTGSGMERAYSYAAQSASDFEYTVSGGTVTLTAYTGRDEAPVIPVSIDGKKVTAIGTECFRGNANIKKIRIPEGITEIGDYAFEACSAATGLSLPSTLKTIGKGAFSGDAQLTELVIPASVQKIDDGAFLYCMGIRTITGGKGLKEMGQFAFAGCESLERADLSGSKLTALPDRAFCNCSKVTEILLPETLESLGKRAFSYCSELSSLSFGPNLRRAGDYCFEKCEMLSDVSFDPSSEGLSIGKSAFIGSGFMSLHIKLPDNTSISEDTFTGCGMTGLYIYGAGRLNSSPEIIVKEGQLCTDNGATIISALVDKYDPAQDKWESVMTETAEGSGVSRFAIPEGVRKIGPEAFSAKTIDNLLIPASVEEIDDKAFFGAYVRSVTLDSGNSSFTVIEGQLLEKNGSGNNEAASGEDLSENAGGSEATGTESAESQTGTGTDNTGDTSAGEISDTSGSGDSGPDESSSDGGSDETGSENAGGSEAAGTEPAESQTGAGTDDIGDTSEDETSDASGSGDSGPDESIGDSAAGESSDGTGSDTETAATETVDSQDNTGSGNSGDEPEGQNDDTRGINENESGDKYRLICFFPFKLENGAKVRITRKGPPSDNLMGITKWIYDFPDYINDIAPYAFCGSYVDVIISESTSLTGFGEYSFANSGIADPRNPDDPIIEMLGMGVITIPESIINSSGFTIADTAFEDAYYASYDFDDEEPPEDLPEYRPETPEDLDFNDRFSRIRDDRRDDESGTLPSGGEEEPADPVVQPQSTAGSRSLYSDEAYKNFKEIPNSKFMDWVGEYLAYNKSVNGIELKQDLMPYTMIYKGESHYRSMVCVLNGDQYKREYSIKNVGDDFEAMYLMMDHGLEAEIHRGEVQDDIILYSGITVERMADIAGVSDKTQKPTEEQLIDAIGREFTDPAFMSTTTNPATAFSFSSYSQTMVIIYASKESLSQLGAVNIDAFAGWGAGEYEILFNLGARFKVIDVGKLYIDGLDEEGRTYIRLQLMEDEETYKITYDLNGGSYNGSTDNIVEEHKPGETISVHEAPVREGYTFSYWKGSEYQPGDKYTVTEDHTFTAVWTADEEEIKPSDENDGNAADGTGNEPEQAGGRTDNTPEQGGGNTNSGNTNSESEQSDSSRPVRTGDDTNFAGWLILMLLSAAGAGGIAYSRRRR